MNKDNVKTILSHTCTIPELEDLDLSKDTWRLLHKRRPVCFYDKNDRLEKLKGAIPCLRVVPV